MIKTAILLAGAAVLLTACDAGRSTSNFVSTSGVGAGRHMQSNGARRAQTGDNLYVVDERGQSVTVYDPSNGSLVRSIGSANGVEFPKTWRSITQETCTSRIIPTLRNTLPERPTNCALFRRGLACRRSSHSTLKRISTLPTAGNDPTYGNSITVYAPGQTKVLREIIAGIEGPAALLFDSAGTLYVSNGGSNAVTEYAGGMKKLTRSITDGVLAPGAMAFDSTGNLYVANCGFLP